MGGGGWSSSSFTSYATSCGHSVRADNTVDFKGKSANQVFCHKSLDKSMDPYNVIRECCESNEHPNAFPIIIGIDVTGSMGPAAMKVASKLNSILVNVNQEVKDAEFLIMGIGDLNYDDAPIQAGQFESDIRIAKQLNNIYFEDGGGENTYESYTAAWYFGLNRTRCDAIEKGKKGIIITIGDEELNPELDGILDYIGKVDEKEDFTNAEPNALYDAASKKFNIFHVHIDHDRSSRDRKENNIKSFAKVIGEQNVFSTELDGLNTVISDIIIKNASSTNVIDFTSIAKSDANAKAEKLEEVVW